MTRTPTLAVRRTVAAGGLLAAMGIGAALGVGMLGTASADTTTTTPTSTASTTPSTGAAAPTAGKSNEDPTHEAGESAAREAAEDNGTATYGPGAATTG